MLTPMATQRIFEINQQYHLYARGVDKRDVFLSEHDYLRFMALIHVCNHTGKVQLGTITRRNFDSVFSLKRNSTVKIDQFCLMPNHFHILCTEIVDGGISKFMQKVLSGYTVFFNKKYHREGALFSSTYKAKHVNDDLYAEYIKKYIQYNPLKLINPEYDSKNFFKGEEPNEEERDFIAEYPYMSK